MLHRFNQALQFAHRGLGLQNESGKIPGLARHRIADGRQVGAGLPEILQVQADESVAPRGSGASADYGPSSRWPGSASGCRLGLVDSVSEIQVGSTDAQPADAKGRARAQGRQDAFGENVDRVLELNRARLGVGKQKHIMSARPLPDDEKKTARQSDEHKNHREAKGGSDHAQHARHHRIQQRIVPGRLQFADPDLDFEEARFGGHHTAAADDHHQLDQHRTEFAGHNRTNSGPTQSG